MLPPHHISKSYTCHCTQPATLTAPLSSHHAHSSREPHLSKQTSTGYVASPGNGMAPARANRMSPALSTRRRYSSTTHDLRGQQHRHTFACGGARLRSHRREHTLCTHGCKATASTSQLGEAAMPDTTTLPWFTRRARSVFAWTACAEVVLALIAAVSICGGIAG